MKLTNKQVEFLFTTNDRFFDRTYVIKLFAVTDRPEWVLPVELIDLARGDGNAPADVPANPHGLQSGDLFVTPYHDQRLVCGYMPGSGNGRICVFGDENIEPLRPTDWFELKPGHIANYPPGKPPFPTTVGMYFANVVMFSKLPNGLVPYTTTFKETVGALDIIAAAIGDNRLSVADYYEFAALSFSLSSYAALFVPTGTERSFTYHPDTNRVKQELLDKYAGQLNNPVVATLIEQAVEELDREHLAGDKSELFLDALGAKMRLICRKKMFGCVGIISDFTTDADSWEFIPESLVQGWNRETLPITFNESRKGSYSRGKETELGGVLTKLLVRLFYTVGFTATDCESNTGVVLQLDARSISRYLGRTMRKAGGEWTVLSDNNREAFIGTVEMRSPMWCKAPDAICYTCAGEAIRKISIANASMLVAEISSTFLLTSMKAMHGTTVSVKDVGPNFAEFLV